MGYVLHLITIYSIQQVFAIYCGFPSEWETVTNNLKHYNNAIML